jgi:arylsulfatase A-like enzyme
VGRDWVTLPQYFKEHGYVSAGAGKLGRGRRRNVHAP